MLLLWRAFRFEGDEVADSFYTQNKKARHKHDPRLFRQEREWV